MRWVACASAIGFCKLNRGGMRVSVLVWLLLVSVGCLGQQADWEKAAGGRAEFEAASVRPDDGPFRGPSFALSADDWFREPNGRFHADFALDAYIMFAYKLWLAPDQDKALRAMIPESMRSQRYAIEATAPLHATKDQYRLMIRALLQERFGLKMHMERHEMPVLEMTLVRPGHPGPKLIPHDQGPSCEDKSPQGVWPPECYSFGIRPKAEKFELGGVLVAGARNVTTSQIADFLGSQEGDASGILRPVVDRTGLAGKWDFSLEVVSATGNAQQDEQRDGPTMLQALRDQLGLRLKPGRADVPVIVIDHIEPLHDN